MKDLGGEELRQGSFGRAMGMIVCVLLLSMALSGCSDSDPMVWLDEWTNDSALHLDGFAGVREDGDWHDIVKWSMEPNSKGSPWMTGVGYSCEDQYFDLHVEVYRGSGDLLNSAIQIVPCDGEGHRVKVYVDPVGDLVVSYIWP